MSVSSWPALLFWPAIVLGLVAAIFGLVWRRRSWLLGGACLMLPASVYLSATPRFQFVGFVPVACLLLAADAVRRDRIWIGGLLVAAGTIFWSAVASMLVVPIVLHVLVAGTAIGLVGARRLGWRLLIYVPVGIIGAFVGAALSFGDAPLLIRHPSLSPWTLSLLAAVLIVAAVAVADSTLFGPRGRSHPDVG